MNRLQINHMDGDQIQVEWQPERGQRRQYLNIKPFSDPLTDDDRSELRWYLEEYLGFPFGAERFRAEQVQKKMEGWGEELFRQVFLQSDAPLTGPVIYYQEAVRSGLDQCELAVVSNDSKFLNIPWELLRDSTAGRGYLAPALGGMFRQRTEHAIQVTPTISPDGPFRVLLVVARPFGETDVPLGTVARPVLEALRPLRDRIEVDVLRPPTFDTLQATLNSNRGYYNAVHFDGHGVFARTPSGVPLDQFGARGQMGHLVFETEDGGEQVVNSEQLGQALAAAHVPLFILNACQSAEEGDESSYSSVASQLVSIGASGVVAMSYSVYATSAARFMERFYQRLVEGDSLTSAVAAGRRGLYASPQHQSMIGELELQDWMVPALYQQEDGYIPIPQIETQPVEPDGEDGDGQLDLLGVVQKSCPEGQFGFIGRDYDILRIERSLRDDNRPWALLAGIGGTGKTEMAYGFARWYAETGGCPGGVFVASFREKTNFGQVIGSIAGFGTDFSRRTPEQQRQMLVNYLRENPCLLIWDNFETVAGFARESDLHATDDEKQSLSDFLRALRGGKSRVLITTRQPDENWLGIAYQLVEMGGLVRQDAAQMARIILDTVGKRLGDFRDDPDYAELLRLIRGHPRSLEVILPNLRSRTPGQIIEALQQRTDDLGEEMDDASLSFSFSRMSEGTQCHLPFIGLFASYVHADVIGNNFNSGDRGDVYREVMGETLEAEDWEAVLNEATRAGFVRLVGNRIYQLHPTIPAFLRRQLASVKGDEDLRRMDAEFMRFYAAWAATYEERMRNGDRNAVVAATIEEANLLRALRLAEAGNHWGLAGVMAPTFNYYYKLRGRREEWAALRFRLLAWTGREMAPDADQDRAFLWMFLLGNEANDAQARHDLDTSESAHKRILDYLTALDDEYAQPNIATSYHQLGNVDYYRQRFDEAEQWYRKALEIFECLGHQPAEDVP